MKKNKKKNKIKRISNIFSSKVNIIVLMENCESDLSRGGTMH